MPPSWSLVWDYFSVSKTNNLLAKCIFCKTGVNILNGNTSSMRKHLNKHTTEYQKLVNAEQERAKENALSECSSKQDLPLEKRQRLDSGLGTISE